MEELSLTALVQQLVLELVGPIITVLVGYALIQRLVQRSEDRRAELARAAEDERAASLIEAEDRRAENAYRQELVTSMIETASALYLETQRYWRAKELPAELVEARARLDDQYTRTRNTGDVIEHQLAWQFPAAKADWHAVMDLLTVRYFQVHGRATLPLRQKNAGDAHSGLSADDLQWPTRILDAYRARLAAAVRPVQVAGAAAGGGVSAGAAAGDGVAAHELDENGDAGEAEDARDAEEATTG